MKVVAIIGARLNSSRLPRKHLLDLAGQPMIARIFERLEDIDGLNEIILATTADDYNRPLIDWAVKRTKHWFAYDGEVNDLVGRVSTALPQDADILVYVCGDSPLVEPRSIRKLIKQLERDSAADYALLSAATADPLIHEGFAVYRTSCWKRIAAASITADQREHVGSALPMLTPAPVACVVEEDPVYAELEHRLSVDTVSDYEFMAEVYGRWYRQHDADSLVSLPWVIEQLKQDETLRQMNSTVRQRQLHDQCCAVWFVISAEDLTTDAALVARTALARQIQDRLSLGVELWIVGQARAIEQLEHIPHLWLTDLDSVFTELTREQTAGGRAIAVLDLSPAGWEQYRQQVQSLLAAGWQIAGINTSSAAVTAMPGLVLCGNESALLTQLGDWLGIDLS